LRHVRFHHLPETRDLRFRCDSVLPDEAGDSLVPTERGKAYVDQFRRVEVPVKVADVSCRPTVRRDSAHRDVPKGVGRTTPAV
jgi:hypothetical protein